jgi:hypothetical protein
MRLRNAQRMLYAEANVEGGGGEMKATAGVPGSMSSPVAALGMDRA